MTGGRRMRRMRMYITIMALLWSDGRLLSAEKSVGAESVPDVVGW